MRKNKICIYAVLLAVFLCLAVFPTIAFAGGGEEEVSLIPEESEKPKTDAVPLTPDGNLTLVDDIAEEEAEDKQFVTLVSKNGNYFYLIIDRAGNKENVYFLNLVDEEDLLALIEEENPKQPQVSQVCSCTNLCEDGKIDPNCPVCRNDLTKCTGKPSTHMSTPGPEKEKNKGTGVALILLLIMGMIGGGGFYYFKVVKNKPNTKGNTFLDEYDFEDDEEDEYEYETEDEDEIEEDEESENIL